MLDRPCAECGFRAADLPVGKIASTAIDSAAVIAAAALAPDAAIRPDPLVWSALEYACHARDVCTVFAARLQLMITRDDPLFPDWDQDAAAVEQQYWAQDPRRVAGELVDAAAAIGGGFDAVTPGQWPRRGRRGNGSFFTVATLGRYLAHDLAHHAHDVTRTSGR